MLISVILAGRGEAHGRESVAHERRVVAAARERSRRKVGIDRHGWRVAFAGLFGVAGHGARGRVFGTFGEQTHAAIGGGAVAGHIGADDVVIQHGFDLHLLVFGFVGEILAAVEADLLGGERDKNNRLIEVILAHHARQFQGGGNTAGIVGDAGGVGVHVGRIAGRAIVGALAPDRRAAMES